MKYDAYIGIDPDIDKNGFAFLNTGNRRIETHKYTFAELVDILKKMKGAFDIVKQTMLVIVEGGHLIKTNWHLDGLIHSRNSNLSLQSKIRLACSIGKSQGENAQRGRDIVEMLEFLNIDHTVIHPYVHDWGKDHRSKISKAELDYVVGYKMKRNNQEERDAALIAWLGAGYPIRRSAKITLSL